MTSFKEFEKDMKGVLKEARAVAKTNAESCRRSLLLEGK